MIRTFKASHFRCLENVELQFGPEFNLVYGDNASGKTSLLEALAYLGRGKSFRGANTAKLIPAAFKTVAVARAISWALGSKAPAQPTQPIEIERLLVRVFSDGCK